MNRSCFGSTIIYFKVLSSAYQDLIILFRSLLHIEKNEYTCSVTDQMLSMKNTYWLSYTEFVLTRNKFYTIRTVKRSKPFRWLAQAE